MLAGQGKNPLARLQFTDGCGSSVQKNKGKVHSSEVSPQQNPAKDIKNLFSNFLDLFLFQRLQLVGKSTLLF